MRVAVVGFCFNHPTGRRNLQALQVLANNHRVEVHVFTVNHWGNFDDKRLHELQTKHFLIHKLRTISLSNEPSQYKYWMVGLFSGLCRIKPDVIYVQNEPVAIDTFVSFLAAKSCSARFGFLSYENIYNQWFFPLRQLERLVLRGSDFLVAATTDVKDVFLKKGADKSKITVIPQTGIDTNLFKKSNKNLAGQLGIPKSKTVLFVGRLMKMKGIDVILNAKKILDARGKKLFYLFVGSGEMSQRLKKMKGRVVVIDWLTTQQLPSVYNTGSVFVYPSIPTEYWIEQFGYSMVEALSCQVPVVASDVSGPRAIVDDNKDGFLIPVGDAGSLASAIERVIDDSSLKTRFGKNGRRKVLRKFSKAVVAAQLFRMCQSIK